VTLTSSDSVVQGFEVRKEFVLKFRVNVPGGIGRTKRDHRSVNLEDIARTMTPCKPSKIILRDAHYSAAELVTEVQTALKKLWRAPKLSAKLDR
jgi:hypothetical protein